MTRELDLDTTNDSYDDWRRRWPHVAIPAHVAAAVAVDAILRWDIVDVALEGLDASPHLRQRFLGVLERELCRGLAHTRAAHAALLAVERAAIGRRALRALARRREAP